jgi:hypothetical protein
MAILDSLIGDCGMHMCYTFSLSYAFCYIASDKCILSIGVSLRGLPIFTLSSTRKKQSRVGYKKEKWSTQKNFKIFFPIELGLVWIQVLRNQLLKSDASPNGSVFAPFFRN